MTAQNGTRPPPPKLKNEQREKAHDKAVSVSGGGDGHNTAAVYGCKKFDHFIWLQYLGAKQN